MPNRTLNEQIAIVNGEKQAQLEAERAVILADMDRRAEDRRERRHIVGSMVEGPGLPTVKGLSPHELRQYSIRNLINAQLEKQRRHDAGNATGTPVCMEEEISQSLAKDLGMLPPLNGGFVPLILASGLDTKSNSAGAYTVATRLSDLITVLRNKSIVLRLGAQLLDGVDSGIAVPTQSTGSTASWVPENGGSDVAQSDSSFAQVVPHANTLQSTSGYSRQLLVQSSLSVEQFLRTDLASATAAALDAACINGQGTGGVPLGLMKTSNVNTYAMGTDGAAPTAVALYDLERQIADASADLGPLAWAATPTMRLKLRQVPLFTSSSQPCWQSDEGADQLLGQPAVVSRNVPQGLTKGANNDCHAIICGDWSQMTIVQFGVLAIVADEFTSKKRNLVEITTHAMFDVVVRRPQSFGIIADARNV
jgi:HK97 family phage major capsid protein